MAQTITITISIDGLKDQYFKPPGAPEYEPTHYAKTSIERTGVDPATLWLRLWLFPPSISWLKREPNHLLPNKIAGQVLFTSVRMLQRLRESCEIGFVRIDDRIYYRHGDIAALMEKELLTIKG